VSPGWDGEDKTFTLRDLTGIEQLTGLRTLKIIYGNEIVDWSPLARAHKLEAIFVAGGKMADLGQLTVAPALQSIELSQVEGRTDPANLAAIDALTTRGIRVTWNDR
jgi:hypothetical protein